MSELLLIKTIIDMVENTSEIKLNHLGLRYPKFSVVYMQIFGMSNLDSCKFDSNLIKKEGSSNSQRKIKQDIDKQIFDSRVGEEMPVARYELEGFNVDIDLADEDYHTDIRIKGRMNVDMAVFFNKTVVLTFSLMVDNNPDNPLSAVAQGGDIGTDQLISLISLTLGGEHWTNKDDDNGEDENNGRAQTASNINLKSCKVSISDLHIDDLGDFVNEIGRASCRERVLRLV